jgi:hypothetical protein
VYDKVRHEKNLSVYLSESLAKYLRLEEQTVGTSAWHLCRVYGSSNYIRTRGRGKKEKKNK